VGLRGRLGRIRRAARRDMVEIPMPGGEVRRFPKRDLAPAYLCALAREGGQSSEDHPLCAAARSSSDPSWAFSVFAGPSDEELPDQVPEDLSES
jgi:hypothetical protein